MVNLQDKPVIVDSPIEVEKALNDIRLKLAEISWVSHPYFIASRFYRKEGSKAFYYPETYAGNGTDYHRLTPDNDYSGMFFFYVGNEKVDYSYSEYNYLTYDIAIIFSVNLKLIDESRLNIHLFTQELIRDVRRKLTDSMVGLGLQYNIKSVTRDLREVYNEFVLDDIEQYNRAPMQCFRFDLSLTIKEDCP